METEKTNDMGALHLIVCVVAVAIVAQIVAQGIAIFGSAIINALQPKQYELTLTFEDGTTETRIGTKKELEKWFDLKYATANVKWADLDSE